jgi:hypothetical protein
MTQTDLHAVWTALRFNDRINYRDHEGLEADERAQNNLLHFTIFSTLPKSFPKFKTVTKRSCKKIFVTDCYRNFSAR